VKINIMAKKNKSRQKKIYSLGGRSSYQGNFNLGKGQLDRMQDDSKISSTNLNATEKTLIETDLKK
jgi:hypothetical protein